MLLGRGSHPGGNTEEAGVRGEHLEPEVVEEGVELEDPMDRCNFDFEPDFENGRVIT